MPSPSAPDDFPRLLILSAAVPETWLAGSLVLFRMLQEYPPERILAVGPEPQSQSQLLPCAYRYLAPTASSRFDLTRFAQLKRSLESLGVLGRIPMSRIHAAVGSFVPDVVLCVMERRDYLDAAHRYARAHGVPLVLIVHDRLESFDVVYAPFRRAQLRRNGETYRFAKSRLCVSPEMVARLAEIYGAPGTVLYPIRSDGLQPRAPELSAQLVSPPALTIGYCGGLGYGYGQRIRETAPALAAAGAQIRIFSRDALDVPGTIPMGSSPLPELWTRVKRDCDVVWLPYGHDAHHRLLYETHFPSKLTEYMALGMPVLISGPRQATGVKWGMAHPAAALTLADDSVDDLVRAVTRLRDDAAFRTSLASASVGGGREFEPEAIRRVFLGALRWAACR
jgi:glycosyltransferase involved in cell wall biosynthesis